MHTHIYVYHDFDLQLFSRFLAAEENGAGIFFFSVFAGFKNFTADEKSLFPVWIVSLKGFVCSASAFQPVVKSH